MILSLFSRASSLSINETDDSLYLSLIEIQAHGLLFRRGEGWDTVYLQQYILLSLLIVEYVNTSYLQPRHRGSSLSQFPETIIRLAQKHAAT